MWAVLLAAIAASPTPQQPQRIAIVPSVARGPHGYLVGGEVEVDLRRMIAERPSLDPTGPASSTLRDQIAACGASASCMATGLAAEGFALGLRVAVDQRFAPPLFTAQLIDASSAQIVREIAGEALSSGDLRGEIQKRVAAMLEAGGYARLARVVVDTTPKDAALTISPRPAFEGEGGVYWVPEGEHTISASARGQLASARVSALPGREASVRLEIAEEVERAVSPWMWAAIGVAALGATASIIAIAASSGVECYCLQLEGNSCPPCP